VTGETAGNAAPRLAARRRRKEWPLVVFSMCGLVLLTFIVLPLLNLIFTTDPAKVIALLRDSSVRNALFLTLSSALIATCVSLALGIPLAYVLAREEFPGKSAIEAIVDMPVVIPHTIAGIALLFVFGRAGLIGAHLQSTFGLVFTDSYWGVVLAMLFVSMPFVVNQARDGFRKVDPRMENVARSLGAGYLGAFWRITLPLTWRALLSGAILTWARAVSEFGSVAVIAYYPKTINTLLFEWYNFFGYTYTKPLATLLLLVALAIFVALRAIAGSKSRAHDQA
jgi:molybdate/tungstate transport system permease protein